MTPGIRPLVAGNWKMNGTSASLPELRSIGQGFINGLDARTDALVCVPATLLSRAAETVSGTPVHVGGEDCHANQSGAHTGDVSAEMLKDAGASHVIVGHSERRTDHGESDATVHAKAEAAWRAGLVAIICVGETRAQRESGATLDVLSTQVAGSVPSSATAANAVLAYEPVWAIGTGLTPTAADVAEAHAHIREKLAEKLGQAAAAKMRILYGGSVKPSNAVELLGVANVDGALVGGASLKAADFLGIAEAYRNL
ncbi:MULTISPECIES: triose-phosphate isomerase [Phyllobacteriaceae]|uniref:Triosephosphate isomerase n=2 Tax=Pseudomonadota TaxID=1224 RepID=A0A1C2DTD4_9HYPH|nr:MULTISPECIES: triose-phosphate isomerase [Mesorhizobium]MBN9236259.1 triose-phosphate isomerase [Mesorhizobium sp.]OCX17905.1 triose-phosphate isomerase [Mesorhizobium hungaricum]